MDIRRTIGRLLAVFVIAGLAFAPMATPASAKRATVVMDGMSAVSADMPCCPDEPRSGGCKDCPLLALCMLTVAQADPSAANGIRISFQVRRLSFTFDDLAADGLVGDPPDHPPRTST